MSNGPKSEPRTETDRSGASPPPPIADNELRICWCFECLNAPEYGLRNPANQYMIVCPGCGNKRCPRASDHRYACTGSNEPGQFGSRYEGPVRPTATAEKEVHCTVCHPPNLIVHRPQCPLVRWEGAPDFVQIASDTIHEHKWRNVVAELLAHELSMAWESGYEAHRAETLGACRESPTAPPCGHPLNRRLDLVTLDGCSLAAWCKDCGAIDFKGQWRTPCASPTTNELHGTKENDDGTRTKAAVRSGQAAEASGREGTQPASEGDAPARGRGASPEARSGGLAAVEEEAPGRAEREAGGVAADSSRVADLPPDILGACLGIRFEDRGDGGVLVRLMVEDDGHWHEKDVCVSEYWLADLEKVVKKARTALVMAKDRNKPGERT